ncbi:MAG: sensor histidine kinase [Mycobacterium sp.]
MTARAPEEWHWLWDAYIAGVCAAAIVASFLLHDRFPGNAAAAAALLAAMVVWVLVFGRGMSREGELNWRTVAFATGAVVLFVVALWFSRVAVVAIPAIYPVIFSALPLVTAIVVTTMVNLVPLAMTLMIEGPSSPDTPVAVAITLLGVVATPVIGIMVVTATRQRAKLAEVVAELEGSRAESARLSRETGAAAERERLAREIHDTLAQGFTSIVTLAQAVESELDVDPAAATKHIELIRTTARENLAEARVMVAGLTPTVLDEGSLAAAIQRQGDRLSAETGIAVKVVIDGQLPALGMAADVVLLRATQEALANVRKHSQAGQVRVELTAADHCVRLSLMDNGIGLCSEHHEGFGLRGMRERVAQVGGTMTVSPTPGGGVTIAVEVPA